MNDGRPRPAQKQGSRIGQPGGPLPSPASVFLAPDGSVVTERPDRSAAAPMRAAVGIDEWTPANAHEFIVLPEPDASAAIRLGMHVIAEPLPLWPGPGMIPV